MSDGTTTTTGDGPQRMKAALGVVGVIVLLLTVMLAMTGGELLRSHWVVLYVGVALVSGILFWVLTPGSSGEVDLKELGIKLGGGAAIGQAFMLLAWTLTRNQDQDFVVPIPADVPEKVQLKNLTTAALSDVGEVRTTGGRRFLYVEFRPGQEVGRVSLIYPDPPNESFIARTFEVTTGGAITEIPARSTSP